MINKEVVRIHNLFIRAKENRNIEADKSLRLNTRTLHSLCYKSKPLPTCLSWN